MLKRFVHPGEVVIARQGETLQTVLGSCVALCVHAPRLGVGGMNHYLLPDPKVGGRLSDNHYGTNSVPNLLRLFRDLGCGPKELIVKLLGGSNRAELNTAGVGSANIEVARRILASLGIRPQGEAVGGESGRKVEFNTVTGEVRYLRTTGPVVGENRVLAEIRSFFPCAIENGLIVMGASTGGTEAIRSVLRALPREIPPILIVQHMPPHYSRSFADHLNELCPFEVREACFGDEVKPNRVLIAPGATQMKIEKMGLSLRVKLTDDPPENLFKPSVDYLFRSAVDLGFKKRVGIILTGMGFDGARELFRLRQSGAYTLGQDEGSSVVYGMPAAASEMGAVNESVHLERIAPCTVRVLNQMCEEGVVKTSLLKNI